MILYSVKHKPSSYYYSSYDMELIIIFDDERISFLTYEDALSIINDIDKEKPLLNVGNIPKKYHPLNIKDFILVKMNTDNIEEF